MSKHLIAALNDVDELPDEFSIITSTHGTHTVFPFKFRPDYEPGVGRALTRYIKADQIGTPIKRSEWLRDNNE